jgi:hypothetical protein
MKRSSCADDPAAPPAPPPSFSSHGADKAPWTSCGCEAFFAFGKLQLHFIRRGSSFECSKWFRKHLKPILEAFDIISFSATSRLQCSFSGS